MKRESVEWTIQEIMQKREQISFPDYQREPKLWNQKDKQLLIDSILIDMDIPKLYFYMPKNDDFEVVDGQQRLWAIWEFIDNEYQFKIHEGDQRLKIFDGKKFNDFPKAIKDQILSYKLQIILITQATEEDLRRLFLRLQLGLLLITGEKLKASVGLMRDFIFTQMVKHPFIETVNVPKRRFAKQTLCAQICINSFSKENINEFSRTRYEDLNYFFKNYEQLQGNEIKTFKDKCKRIISVLHILNTFWGTSATELRNRSFILTIYLYVEELVKESPKQINIILPKFVVFISLLLNRLQQEVKAGIDRKNKELYVFESYLSNAPGEKYQIERRHNKLKEFFDYFQKKGRIMGDSQ